MRALSSLFGLLVSFAVYSSGEDGQSLSSVEVGADGSVDTCIETVLEHPQREVNLYHSLASMTQMDKLKDLNVLDRGVAVGFGACLDGSISAIDILNNLGLDPYKITPRHHDKVGSLQDLAELFTFYFSEGAAAERYVSNKAVWAQITSEAKRLRPTESWTLGGNAAWMANRMAMEGVSNVLLGAWVSEQSLVNALHPSVTLSSAPDTNGNGDGSSDGASGAQNSDVHIVLEYHTNDQWGPFKSPRANRLILHSDTVNAEIWSLEPFDKALTFASSSPASTPSLSTAAADTKTATGHKEENGQASSRSRSMVAPSMLVIGGLHLMQEFPYETQDQLGLSGQSEAQQSNVQGQGQNREVVVSSERGSDRSSGDIESSSDGTSSESSSSSSSSSSSVFDRLTHPSVYRLRKVHDLILRSTRGGGENNGHNGDKYENDTGDSRSGSGSSASYPTPIHFEFASVSNVDFLEALHYALLEEVDSVGCNEQELGIIYTYLYEGTVSYRESAIPRVADILDKIYAVMEVLRPQRKTAGEERKVGGMEDDKEGEGEEALLPQHRGRLTRLHVHTLAYQVIATVLPPAYTATTTKHNATISTSSSSSGEGKGIGEDKNSEGAATNEEEAVDEGEGKGWVETRRWRNTRESAAMSSLVATEWICDQEVKDSAYKNDTIILLDDSFSVTRNGNGGNGGARQCVNNGDNNNNDSSNGDNSSSDGVRRIQVVADRGVSCWVDRYRSLEICLAPNLVCKRPKRTAAAGDNISAAGLVPALFY